MAYSATASRSDVILLLLHFITSFLLLLRLVVSLLSLAFALVPALVLTTSIAAANALLHHLKQLGQFLARHHVFLLRAPLSIPELRL